MDIARDAPGAGPRLTGFTAAGGFKVDGRAVEGGLLLTRHAATAWTPPPLNMLAEAALEPVLASPPEFLLLGTGATQAQPAPALRRALEARGIGVEAMDSRAAARLWGVLRAEGREIAAALYPLG